MRIRCSARSTSSRCTASVSWASCSASSRIRPRTEGAPLALDRVATCGRGGHGLADPRENLAGGVANRGGNDRPPSACLARLLLLAPGGALLLGRAHQLVGATVHGTHPLLAGTHRKPGLEFGLPSFGNLRNERVPLGSVRVVRLVRGGLGEP
jgi:hypothetical protein